MVALADLGELAKAYEDAPMTKPTADMTPEGYRKSKMSWTNPTQETWVKQGTKAKRYTSRTSDALTGVPAGKRRNIASGDTVQFHRVTGQRAPKWNPQVSAVMRKVK